jgi:hypothetical protein
MRDSCRTWTDCGRMELRAKAETVVWLRMNMIETRNWRWILSGLWRFVAHALQRSVK